MSGFVVDRPRREDFDLFEPAAIGRARDDLPELDESDWWYEDEDPLFVPMAEPDAAGTLGDDAGWWSSRAHRILAASAGALAAVLLLLIVLGGDDGDRSVTTAQRPTTTRAPATSSTTPETTTTIAAGGTTAVETTEPTRPPATAQASNTRPRSTVTPSSTDAPRVDPPVVLASNPSPTNPPPTNPPPTPTTTQPPPPLPTGWIAISPSSIETGYPAGTVVLSWESSGADTVTVTGPGVDQTAKAGSVWLCPSGDDPCSAPGAEGTPPYTYTLTVTNAAGTQQYFATLTILPPLPPPGP